MDLPFQRRPTTQDISWILDLDRNKQLDLSPPYQRRSVWTRKDRQFFLDTIFRGFPSPAIFLHKTVTADGKTEYHVVDGRQRLETILAFVAGKLRMKKDYGDIRLDGKNWAQLEGEPSLREGFWNYQLTVEMVNVADASIINDVFDRLNRNSRKLTRQELRHAKFDGWFMKLIEEEAKKSEWKTFGIATAARERRMADSQAIAELVLVLLERSTQGFDQDALDEHFAKYDDLSPESEEPEMLGIFRTEEEFDAALSAVKTYLLDMEKSGNVVSTHAKSFANLYTLWSVVALNRANLPAPAEAASRYKTFMQNVEQVSAAPDLETLLQGPGGMSLRDPIKYWTNLRGANTDLAPRTTRFDTLLTALR